MNDNMKKGLVTVTLSVTLLFSTPVYGIQASELNEQELTDIKEHWAYQDIAFIENEGLLFPVENHSFLPNQEITRAEFVSMIVQALSENVDMEVEQPFDDVELDQWYTLDVFVAKQLGIVEGGIDGLFKPNDLVTRAEMATLIKRSFSELDMIRPAITFEDVSERHWAYESIYFSSQAGIIVGHKDYTFKPQQHATRAEAAVMISRVLQGGSSSLPPMVDYTVENGDSVWKIAQKYEVSLESIIEVNQLESEELQIGQELKIPTNVTLSKSESGETPSNVELIEWSQASEIFSIGKTATVTDFYTGKTFQVKRTYGANHADVEPLTKADTATMNEIWGGHTWDTRPIIVEVDGRYIAAAMHNMPHSVQKIYDNNYNGHSCIHFLGSRKHYDGSIWAHMQRDAKIAAGQNK
jgi:LysM repeat protein